MLEIIVFVLLGVPAVLISRALTKTAGTPGHDEENGAAAEPFDFNSFGHCPWGAASHWNDSDDTAATGRIGMMSETEQRGEVARFAVNPETGLPMVSRDESGVDVMGNPYGFDLQHDHFDGIGRCDLDGSGSWVSDWSGSGGGSFDRSGDWR